MFAVVKESEPRTRVCTCGLFPVPVLSRLMARLAWTASSGLFFGRCAVITNKKAAAKTKSSGNTSSRS